MPARAENPSGNMHPSLIGPPRDHAPTTTRQAAHGMGSSCRLPALGLALCALGERESAQRMAALLAVVVAAFVLRLLPTLLWPNLNWADEVFQTTEQAHRLVYGTGLVPWEFQLGIRSWLLPGVIAGLMEFARLFGQGPDYYLPAIASACALVATIPAICCFLWCERWFDLPAALTGGLCVAAAPELAYMGDRTLNEVWAAHLLVLGAYLLLPGRRVGPRRCLSAGAVLALVFVLRPQLAPAVALVALWNPGRETGRNLSTVLAGGLCIVALAALLDALTLGSPLASIWRYVQYNVLDGVSATFGTEPWYYYAAAELAIWGGALPILIVLAAMGTRRTWLPLATALVIIGSHSFIAHKEYRFIYPAVVLLAIQAGVGLAGLTHGLVRRIGRSAAHPELGHAVLARRAVPALAVACWCALSLIVWESPALAALRQRAHDNLVAMSFVAHDRAACGVGLYGKYAWTWYGGYTYLHRPIPMFWPENEAQLRAQAPGFDVLLYSRRQLSATPVMPTGFVRSRCFGRVCAASRPGRCAAIPMTPMPFPAPLAALAPHGAGAPVGAR